ncbi:ankyrin repeat domain-containing protein 60, partial [Aspergillus niger]
MLLLDLPGELLLCVMDHLERAKDIHSLCLTNSHVYRQLLPALYRFNIRFQNSSALHWAARYGKLELIQTMCVYRARVNVYLHGYTPLHFAAMFGQAPVVRWLLSYDGIDVNCRGEGLGLTPLGVAVRKKDVEVVQVLLSDARTDINAGSRDNKTPLLDAIKHRHL